VVRVDSILITDLLLKGKTPQKFLSKVREERDKNSLILGENKSKKMENIFFSCEDLSKKTIIIAS
jgi:hypothetical protein